MAALQWTGKPGGMNYVRWRYGVPAKRGMTVEFILYKLPCVGKILSASGGKLHVLAETGEKIWLHPADGVRYVTE